MQFTTKKNIKKSDCSCAHFWKKEKVSQIQIDLKFSEGTWSRLLKRMYEKYEGHAAAAS